MRIHLIIIATDQISAHTSDTDDLDDGIWMSREGCDKVTVIREAPIELNEVLEVNGFGPLDETAVRCGIAALYMGAVQISFYIQAK